MDAPKIKRKRMFPQFFKETEVNARQFQMQAKIMGLEEELEKLKMERLSSDRLVDNLEDGGTVGWENATDQPGQSSDAKRGKDGQNWTISEAQRGEMFKKTTSQVVPTPEVQPEMGTKEQQSALVAAKGSKQ